MKSTVIFAAIFAVANALPSLAPMSEQDTYLSLIGESFEKREDDVDAGLPANYRGPKCSTFKGKTINEVPPICWKPMFCDKLKENPSTEQCNFGGRTRFPKSEIDKMSPGCFEQAICNVVNGPQKGSTKPEESKSESSEPVRDVELTEWPFQNNEYDRFSVKCSDYLTEAKWQFAGSECYYNTLCVQPVPANEPKCTTLDPAKKTYTLMELTDDSISIQCARELICKRAKNPLVTPIGKLRG